MSILHSNHVQRRPSANTLASVTPTLTSYIPRPAADLGLVAVVVGVFDHQVPDGVYGHPADVRDLTEREPQLVQHQTGQVVLGAERLRHKVLLLEVWGKSRGEGESAFVRIADRLTGREGTEKGITR